MKTQFQKITREKHLDHMVNVVPFIVMGYAVQSYVIFQMAPEAFTRNELLSFGLFLAFMIGGFIYYDHYHQVTFQVEGLDISFLGKKKRITYSEIWSVKVIDPGQSFSTMVIESAHGKNTFYFVDQADELKAWIESQKESKLMAA